MGIPTLSRSEAYRAQCLDCDWTNSTGSSRTIRKEANRHAARKRHMVSVDYHKELIVCGHKLGARP